MDAALDRAGPWRFEDLAGLHDRPRDGRCGLPGLAAVRVPGVPSIAAGPCSSYGPEHFGLVVEVVSPSSRKTDRFTEPGKYAEAGLPLFWRVKTEPEVLAFWLGAGSCVPAGQVRDRGCCRCLGGRPRWTCRACSPRRRRARTRRW